VRVRALGAAAIVIVACQGPAVAPQGGGDGLDRIARACAKIASCAHGHDEPREHDPSACVDASLARSPAEAAELEACVQGASGCEQVGACVRGRVDASAAAHCRAHPGARTSCDGNRLVTCSADDPNESTSVDCAAFGATCGDAHEEGGLLAHACVSPSLCPAGAPEVRCDGERAILGCHGGAVERTPCAAGARCEAQKGADGVTSALCEPVGHRHCDVVGKRWCERANLVSCQPHGSTGEVAATDCGAAGLVCDDRVEGGAACVVPTARTCDHGAPRCDGDALVFCAAGARVRVGCRDLGFTTCDPDAHGVDAACTVARGP
jgi:hypothetical protein